VPIFPTLTFRRAPAPPPAETVGRDLPEDVRQALPMRFEAVGEALVGGVRDTDVIAACTVVGRDVARDGAALGEALSGLRTTYDLVLGVPPAFEAAEALSVAWSDATLEYLHDLSCEDPLTGLASLAHLRTRLDELYRESELSDVGVAQSHALGFFGRFQFLKGNGVAGFEPLHSPQARHVEQNPASHNPVDVSRNVHVGRALRSHYARGFSVVQFALVGAMTECVNVGAGIAVNFSPHEISRELRFTSRDRQIEHLDHVVDGRPGIIGPRDGIEGQCERHRAARPDQRRRAAHVIRSDVM